MAVWTVAGSCAQGPVWRTCQIVNKRTFTYESVLEDTGISNKLKELLGAAVSYSGNSGGSTYISEDPHRWIELAMITYNRAAAEVLSAKGAGILRRHRGILATEYQEIAEKTGCREIAFLGYAAGEYAAAAACSGRSEESEGTVHAGLGLTRYCHASSPLRRYADLVNQRILVGGLGSDGNPSGELVTWLNERGKEARTYEREAWYLAHLSAKELSREHGWVLGWTSVSNNGNDSCREARVHVYVPEWRRQIKVVLSVSNAGDYGGIWVKTRDGSGEAWQLEKGIGVQVTAFWDTRSTPEYRFVFNMQPLPPKS
jgi:hypothetical protein